MQHTATPSSWWTGMGWLASATSRRSTLPTLREVGASLRGGWDRGTWCGGSKLRVGCQAGAVCRRGARLLRNEFILVPGAGAVRHAAPHSWPRYMPAAVCRVVRQAAKQLCSPLGRLPSFPAAPHPPQMCACCWRAGTHCLRSASRTRAARSAKWTCRQPAAVRPRRPACCGRWCPHPPTRHPAFY